MLPIRQPGGLLLARFLTLTLMLIVGVTTRPAFALRGMQQTENRSGLEELTNRLLEGKTVPILAGMEEPKEQLRRRLQAGDSVRITQFWDVTSQGWTLKRFLFVDSQGERWNATLEGEPVQTSPIAGAYISPITNAPSLGIKEETVPVAVALVHAAINSPQVFHAAHSTGF